MRKDSARLRLGFIPTRRGMAGEKAFNKATALAQKQAIQRWIERYPVDLVTLDGLNEEGLLYDGLQAEAAARIMRDAGVEALFAPHCNFGCEDAVARTAARVGVPLLLWGPGGETIDAQGYRYRDSQCGLFATSKVLQRAGEPFSYITSCPLEDPLFDRGFENFIRAASAAKMLRSARIGQISLRPEAFWSVKINEGELLEQFGIEIVPQTLKDFEGRFQQALKDTDAIRREVDELTAFFKTIHIPMESLERVAALELCILRWAEEAQLDAAATTCWAPMYQTTGLAPCLALSQLSERRFPTICECDLHGAVSSLLAMGAAMGDSSTFLADITIRHPENPNAELLWHCGVFAKNLAENPDALRIAPHYNRLCPAVGEWELKKGPLNVVRFDGFTDNYSMFLGRAEGIPGPKTVGAYLWIEVDDWSKWEKKLIYGPYIHHCVGIYRDVKDVLEEACRYIPGLRPDPV